MEKKNFVLAAVMCIFFTTQAQTVKFGVPEEMEQKGTAALDGVAGVLNNTYFVVENDFGKSMDFKNNIRTKIRRYSVSNLGNKGLVYLNPLVGDGLDEDKIIFTDIFQWNNRVVGFYTIKAKATKEIFPVYARFFDGNLKPIGKKDILVGEINHQYESNAYFGQSGGILNGRNKLAVRDEFLFSISPDSSTLVIMMPAPSKSDFNVKCRIIDKELSIVKEVTAVIPIQSKRADIAGFQIGNNGTVYLLTKTYKSKAQRKEEKDEDAFITEIHSINPENGNVQSKPINISGKTILKPTFTIDALGKPTIVCMYSDNSRDNNAHGIYALKIDPVSLAPTSQDQREFDSELLLNELDEKDIKKGRGILPVEMENFTHRPDGGIYAIGRWSGKMVVARGSTGAMNSYYNIFGTTVFCYVDAAGKVRWSKGMKTDSESLEALTPVNGAVLLYRDNKAYVGFASDNGLKKKELKRGIQFNSFDDNGVKTTGRFNEFTEGLEDFEIVTSTFSQVSSDQYMFCIHYGSENRHRKKMETAVVQVKF